MNTTYLRNLISMNEGRKDTMYLDSLGVPTIGVGFNLDRTDAKELIENLGLDYAAVRAGAVSLTDGQIDALLDHDIDQAIADAKTIFLNFHNLSPNRQAVLVDMSFNLGLTRLKKFVKFIANIENNDFDGAVREMIDSAWNNQVGKRAERLEVSMKTDQPVTMPTIYTA